MNDNEPPLVWIILGRVTRRKGGPESNVHVMLRAPDDDSAVRRTLEALQKEGFVEAELDQIGERRSVDHPGVRMHRAPHRCFRLKPLRRLTRQARA
jgi:hypothetical protein